MSKHVLKSVALAVGALVSSAAMSAAVDLDAASPTPVRYANELMISVATLLEDGAAADQTATAAFGASFGVDVTAYVRIEVAGGVLTGTPSFAVAGSNGAATVSVAQSGTGYIIYAVTPATGGNLVSANLATFDTDTGASAGVTVTTKDGVTLRYRLFETLTAAVNPTGTNTLKDTGAKSYIAFSNAFSTTLTTVSAVADVAASPSYTLFVGAPTNIKPLGTVTFALASRALANGSVIALTDIFSGTNTFTSAGSFVLARNDDLTYTGSALTRVFLHTAADCTSGTSVSAATLSATTATFNRTAAQLTGTLTQCVQAEGTPEISPSSYTIAVNYVENTGYAVTDMTTASLGNITRNGVRMVAPLVNQPAGWFSRLVMTNTGSGARDYTISYLTEEGTTIVVTGAGNSGTLAAGKTTLINLPAVTTITPGAGLGVRASLVVTVNAPQSEIDGLYQIVNPTGGAISNYILVYKN